MPVSANNPTLPRRARKYIRDHSHLSIEKIVQLIAAGKVRWRTPGQDWAPASEETLIFESDEVEVSGQQLVAHKSLGAYLLNKPKGVTCTTSDPRGKQDLRRWLSDMPPGYFPVGRLDRDTTGALLFCNDGDLSTAVLRPEHKLSKLYWLWLGEQVTAGDPRIARWLSGMACKEGTARAEKVSVLHSTPDMSELLVTLREGKNRQIRRMCRASDFRLLHLHRKQVGSVSVQRMEVGELRPLSPGQLSELWRQAGGVEAVFNAQLLALVHKAGRAAEAGEPLPRLQRWLTEHESFVARALVQARPGRERAE